MVTWKKTPDIRAAGPYAQMFLDWFKFGAVVSPWRTIYIDPKYMGFITLRQHEVAHLGQMDRDGWLTFWVKCLWWYFTLGHEKSPYEIEARSAEGVPDHPLLKDYIVA